MVTFPRITGLTTEGYQLYPGREGNDFLKLEFEKGPWVVLGVNGIGKSTLLLLLKHLLVGSVVSRSAGFAGEGANDLFPIDKGLFGVRVEDRARNARATLECKFGFTRLTVVRNLYDLSLISASAQERRGETEVGDEDSYQELLTALMGLKRFEDVVGVMDRVIFKLERRVDLLWDQDAQFEIFKAILTPEISRTMRDIEGRIISADSRARNLHAQLYRASRDIAKEDARERSQASVKARLADAQAELETAEASLAGAIEALDNVKEARLNARLYLKRSEKDVENAADKYETIKLKALQSAFHELDQSSSYLLLRVLADHRCPACGADASELAAQIEHRQKTDLCVICSTELSTRRKSGGKIASISPGLQKKATAAFETLTRAQQERDENAMTRAEAEAAWKEASEYANSLSTLMDEISRQILRLEKKLPKGDRVARHAKQGDINAWRLTIEALRRDRAKAEAEYSEFVAALRRKVEKIKSRFAKIFQKRAEPFFGDQARLKYVPRSRSIGQYGESFEFPAFEIEMNAGPGYGEFIRREGEQVSLSQREYLDIIFRMSLIETISARGGSSFVIDGPEVSVDAVFGERAGILFADFAESDKRNLILACNVVEGALIPKSLGNYGDHDEKRARIVNLLEIARPTSTLERLRIEYEEKVEKIISYDDNN